MARQMECLPSLLDLFYVSGCKKAHGKRVEREGPFNKNLGG